MIDYAKEKVILAGMILGGILTLTSCGPQERGDVLNTAESREIEEYTGDTQTEGEDGGAAAEVSSEMAETILETEETYLAELDIHPLYAAFLLGEISVPNPFESGSELSFFDDREYAREEHVFEYASKSFSLVDVNNDGVSELIFKIYDSPDELMYILGVQEDKLICYDVQETHTIHMSFRIYGNGIVTWGQNFDGEEDIYYTYDEWGVPHELIHFVREGRDSESDLCYDYYYRDGDETAKCSLQNNEEYEALAAPYKGEEPEWFFCDSFADIPNESFSKKSQEDKFCLWEQQAYYDIWEEEHVLEIGFGYNENEINLSSLGNLVELESLDINIQHGCWADLSFVVNMSQLKSLHMTVGSNVDLSPLGSLDNLRQLSIDTWGDELDLSFLRKLNQLEEVTIDKGTIEDLSLFQNMPNLQNLDVSYIDDCDLKYLANLKNLETLAIIGENIRNPEGLRDLTHLKSLALYDNSSDAMYNKAEEKVPFDMKPFINLSDLERLYLIYIYIEDISPLSNLSNLRHISLTGTDVGDILPLTSLERLDELFLFGNKSKQVKEQAEKFFCDIEYMIVTEEIPNGL